MLGHEKLLAWKLCHELVLAVYQASQKWPIQERYGLTAQIRRAASSAPTNIAEGAAKRGSREYRRFLEVALGSLSATAYLLMLARDLEILSSLDWERLDDLRRRAGGLTWRLARSLDHKGKLLSVLSVFSAFSVLSAFSVTSAPLAYTELPNSSYSRAAHLSWFHSAPESVSRL